MAQVSLVIFIYPLGQDFCYLVWFKFATELTFQNSSCCSFFRTNETFGYSFGPGIVHDLKISSSTFTSSISNPQLTRAHSYWSLCLMPIIINWCTRSWNTPPHIQKKIIVWHNEVRYLILCTVVAHMVVLLIHERVSSRLSTFWSDHE